MAVMQIKKALDGSGMKRKACALLAVMGTCVAMTAHAETVTLTVNAFRSFDLIIKAAIPAWKKLHPDVDIKVVSRESVDHHDTMMAALAAGSSQIDVMPVELDFLGQFAESGALEDLSKVPYNGLLYRKKFVDYTFPLATNSRGELIAIPADVGPGTLFYRKDILEKANVTEADLIGSWESYIESGKKIKAATGVYLLGNAGHIKDIVIRSNLSDGEGIYFDRAKKVIVDRPRFVKAFTLAKAVRDAKLDLKLASWSKEWIDGFRRGTVATQMMGAWMGTNLANYAPATKGLWRATNLPNDAYSFWGGTFYTIPKKSKNKEIAWEFIKFMTLNKANQLDAFKAQDAFPALLEAQIDPFFDQPVEFLGGQKVRVMWRDAVRRIPAIDISKHDLMAAAIVNVELDKVLDQGKDIKTALADAKALIEARVRP
jgi:multiple sugar transport system substrate-binding protein